MVRTHPKPMNILLVMFDQMSALSLPLYGHPVVQTPYLTALAKDAAVFERAYCNSPLCSPSRHSMLTGRMPSRIGAYDNAAELASSIPTFVHLLRDAGYRTCLSGKMDFTGADQLHGFEERLTTDLSPSDFAWTPNWEEPERLYDWFHSLQSVAEAGPCDRSLTMDYDEEATHQAERWLYAAAGASDRRPFLLTVSYMHPHDPYLGPRTFWDRYRDSEIDMPTVPPLSLNRRHPADRRLHALYDRGQHMLTEGQIRAARRAYYAMIGHADEQLGRLRRALEIAGHGERTAVVVTADHGDMLGERGLWYKMTFYERAVRVPLIMRMPGRPQPGRVAQPVSLVDLFPTLLDLTATRPSQGELELDGNSLLPAAIGLGAPPGTVYGEYMAEGTEQPMFMIRRGRWKYITCPGDTPRLYDLQSDPHELDNLSGRTAGAAVERKLEREASRGWDAAALRRAVVDSQRSRRLVHGALMRGRLHPWDYEPRRDAAVEYFRNYGAPDPERPMRLPYPGPPSRPRGKKTPPQ
jgi:choline-sulfatase